jgi:hypothetical protein
MHVLVSHRTVKRTARLSGFVFGIFATVTAAVMQKCAICGVRWWTGVCPRCKVDALD